MIIKDLIRKHDKIIYRTVAEINLDIILMTKYFFYFAENTAHTILFIAILKKIGER